MTETERKRKDKKVCFRIESGVYEVLQIIADYHNVTVSDIIRYLAYDLAISFYLGIPRRVIIPDVARLLMYAEEQKARREGGER